MSETEPIGIFVVLYGQMFLHLQPQHLEPGSSNIDGKKVAKCKFYAFSRGEPKAESLRRHMESEPELEFRQVSAAAL